MIIIMDPRSEEKDVQEVLSRLRSLGAEGRVFVAPPGRMVEVLGRSGLTAADLAALPHVRQVVNGAPPLLATERADREGTRPVIVGRGVRIGGRRLATIAGPCSVETRAQVLEIAHAVKEAGAVALRGGAFKPRTSPYCFQGHGEAGLEILAEAREATGLPIVTEVLSPEHVGLVARYADVLQVGSRNMHNSALLRAVGEQDKPVLLKRGWSATLDEFLLAAEYIMAGGNRQIILCERGIRTHETYVRNTLALAIVPELKRRTALPVIVDPSHGTGRAHLVAPMSAAAVACGADGLLIEVHCDPSRAWSDGDQSLDLVAFRGLMNDLRRIAAACRRSV